MSMMAALRKFGVCVALWTSAATLMRAEEPNGAGKAELAAVTLENFVAPRPNRADEPLAKQFSLARAAEFMDSAALDWQKSRQCFTCHTNYAFLLARPAISADGPAHAAVRSFAEKLVADWNRSDGLEQDPKTSDGYGTGFVVYVLRRAGLTADDARLQRGIAWLKANQRESGRWFTRSLNKDGKHFISHAGTAFAVLALASCEP
jgi:hypothetical protein